jgi:hypothetical protein
MKTPRLAAPNKTRACAVIHSMIIPLNARAIPCAAIAAHLTDLHLAIKRTRLMAKNGRFLIGYDCGRPPVRRHSQSWRQKRPQEFSVEREAMLQSDYRQIRSDHAPMNAIDGHFPAFGCP